MYRSVLKFVAVATLISSLLTVNVSALGKTDYVLDKDGKTHKPIPVCYIADTVYTDLGDGGFLNNPYDLFTDNDCNLFIADTDNNRIVKLNSTGEFIREFTCNGSLKTPKGVYVSESGDIYISDSGNQRIVHTDADGNYIEEFVKPESDMLDEEMDFGVNRLRISNQGYLMMIKGTKFMSMDADNNFKGYIGSNKLGFSLKRTFTRIFASDEQKAQLLKEEPVAYNSFDIATDGMIYAVTAEEQASNQICKINAVGENVYPSGVYGEKYYNEHTQKYNSPRFSSIAVDENDIIYVLEAYSGRIYVYDQEGSILCVFGGMGNIKGTFASPVALEVDGNGSVYVLDSSTGYVHVFKPTEFIQKVYAASELYSNGEYEKASEIWQEVLQVNVNYDIANLGYSRCLYKLGDNKRAEHYAELASDKSIYGDAFSEFRYTFFQNNFALVVLLIAAAIALAIAVVVLVRRRAGKWVNDFFEKGAEKHK